jgi:hypothetical protein
MQIAEEQVANSAANGKSRAEAHIETASTVP